MPPLNLENLFLSEEINSIQIIKKKKQKPMIKIGVTFHNLNPRITIPFPSIITLIVITS